MRKCSNCGKLNHDAKIVCVDCGANLNIVSKNQGNSSSNNLKFTLTGLVAVLHLIGLIIYIIFLIISFNRSAELLGINPIIHLIFISFNAIYVGMLFELRDVVQKNK